MQPVAIVLGWSWQNPGTPTVMSSLSTSILHLDVHVHVNCAVDMLVCNMLALGELR